MNSTIEGSQLDSTETALDGVRVLELGHGLAGAFGARILGDLGADVIKIERPGDGDGVRGIGPFGVNAAGERQSALFEYVNWNKRGMALDLAAPASRETLEELVRRADIVIETFRPGALESWGIDVSTLRQWNPRAIVVSISPFGQSGPYAQFKSSDLVLQAMGGVSYLSGTVDKEPIKPGLRQSAYWAGINAAYSALAALYGRADQGPGAHLDLSILEVVASQMVVTAPLYAFTGVVQGRRSPAQDPMSGDPLRSADGFVSMQMNYFTKPQLFAELFHDQRLDSEEFATESSRKKNSAKLAEILVEHIAKEPSRDLFVRAATAGALVGFSQSAEQLLECSHLASRSVFASVGSLQGIEGPLRYPTQMMSLSQTPTSIRRSAPKLGEHQESVLAELGSAPIAAADHELAPPAGKRGPLDGIRVVDLSTVFAVPYMGALLADLGADVIKIEAPGRLDQTRAGFGLPLDNDESLDYWDRFSSFQCLNRGKRAVSVDLSTDEGREILLALVADADVLLDNFTPRVMKKWGTTYASLKEVNPRLVMLSNTGYGSTGPWSSFKAQGTTLEATMGLTHYTGYAGGKPAKAGQSQPDFIAAWTGLTAIMAALVHRRRSGRGQWIDLGMYQLGAASLPEAVLHFQTTGEDLPRAGSTDLGAILSGVFAARGTDRWLAVSIGSREELRALGKVVPAIGRIVDAESSEELPLPRITEAFAGWVAGQAPREAMYALQESGIAAGPVSDARDLFCDEQLRDRAFWELAEIEPGVSKRPLISRPYRWDSASTCVGITRAAPKFADANEEILIGRLGLSRQRLEELRRAEVVADAPLAAPLRTSPANLDTLVAMRVMNAVRVDSDYRSVIPGQ